jgi:hypothetical protein
MSNRERTICLLCGVFELGLTVCAWALVSPYLGLFLEELRPVERVKVLAFAVCGPLSALPAAVTMLRHRRLGALWLVGGGLVSGVMALSWFFTDRGVLLAPPVSIPMIGVGLWQLLSRYEPAPEGNDVPAPRPRSLVLGVAFFLAGWLGTYALIMILIVNDVLGLHDAADFGPSGVIDAKLLVVLLVGVGVALLTLTRQALRIRGEFLAGQWVAVFLATLVILAA